MEVGSPSRTAVMTAIHRAAHFLIDEPPKILADSFARAFAGFSSDKEFPAVVDSYAFPDFAAHRASFALRNRYAEDQLATAVASGTVQYVILGAGLDSFAYRCPDALRGLQIFEVDHLSSQAWKQARLAELGIEAPPTLRYVSIDFERETLTARLDAGGVDRKAKAFFSWLGVTQYLTPDAVLKTLREIASASVAGSGIVATFVVPASILNRAESELLAAIAERSASVGESWLSLLEPGEMIALMQQAGFVDICCFGLRTRPGPISEVAGMGSGCRHTQG
jgi:methyltransferase (TIGR00027 family)